MTRIIGLAGKKQSGKDTAAKALLDIGYTKLSFASTLRDICYKSLDLPKALFYDEDLKEVPFDKNITLLLKDIDKIIAESSKYIPVRIDQAMKIYRLAIGKELKTPREALMFIGTEIIRDCVDEDFLVKVLINKLKEHDKVIITDVRFPNERQALRIRNSILGLIVRDNEKQDNVTELHASENSFGEIEEYDFVLYNDLTIKDLRNNILRFIGE